MKSRIVIFIITIFLICCMVFIYFEQLKTADYMPVSFNIKTSEQDENVTLWMNSDGKVYVFIPAYASLNDVEIVLHNRKGVFLDETPLSDGMICSIFQIGEWYEFRYKKDGEYIQTQLTFLQSANVATMYINTKSGNMDYIYFEKGNYEPGTVSLYTSDGELNYSGVFASLKGRGNTTWESYEKKPYSLTLKEESDLLDMGAAKEWILLANADDPSHMRNKIVYEFAKDVGMEYVPDSKWIDLYLNGEYAGLYLLVERIEPGTNRVNIETSWGDEQSGYIVSMEMKDRMEGYSEFYVSTDTGQYLRVNAPKELTDIQLETIRREWQSVENAIMAENGIDDITGKHYSELIDTESWVKKYIIEEIFVSVDACYISQYFYSNNKTIDSKIYAGPVWDFDHSIARSDFTEPYALVANRQYVFADVYTPWFYSLYQKEDFYNDIVLCYETNFEQELDILIQEKIPAYYEEICIAAYNDRLRWEQSIIMESDIDSMRAFLIERKDFLDCIWVKSEEWCNVAIDSKLTKIKFCAVRKGETLSGLPEIESESFIGWYVKETEKPFDITQPITHDLEIYAKWEQ